MSGSTALAVPARAQARTPPSAPPPVSAGWDGAFPDPGHGPPAGRHDGCCPTPTCLLGRSNTIRKNHVGHVAHPASFNRSNEPYVPVTIPASARDHAAPCPPVLQWYRVGEDIRAPYAGSLYSSGVTGLAATSPGCKPGKRLLRSPAFPAVTGEMRAPSAK